MRVEPKKICQIFRFQLLFKMNFKKGFTLIELLVVVAIIGVLSTIGLVAYNKYTEMTQKAVAKNNFYTTVKYFKAELAYKSTPFSANSLALLKTFTNIFSATKPVLCKYTCQYIKRLEIRKFSTE